MKENNESVFFPQQSAKRPDCSQLFLRPTGTWPRTRARTFGLITFSLGRSPPPPPPAVEVFCLIRLQANLIKTQLLGGR